MMIEPPPFSRPPAPREAACPVCGRLFRSRAGMGSHIAKTFDDAHAAYAWNQPHYIRGLRAREGGYVALVDELGEEVLGLRWIALRPFVVRWMDANPERVYWLALRLHQLMSGGPV